MVSFRVPDWVAVFVGGVVGTAARAGLDEVAKASPVRGLFLSWSTLTVNVVGAFLLGTLAAWVAGRLARGAGDPASLKKLKFLAGTGFAGAFTTYGTYIVASVGYVSLNGRLSVAGSPRLGGCVCVGGDARGGAAVRPLGGLSCLLGLCDVRERRGGPSMSTATFLFVALAGGVGACARFWLDRGVQRALDSWGDPAGAKLGILVVNVIGCFLAGAATQLTPASIMPIVSTGFLGGFTTFSTALVDAVTLWADGFRGRSLALALGTWAASWGAALAGIAVA